MLSSRRQFLVAAGLGAAMTVIGAGCSGGSPDPTAVTGDPGSSGAGVLDGVRADVRRDPG
jgi:hypothetical protein